MRHSHSRRSTVTAALTAAVVTVFAAGNVPVAQASPQPATSVQVPWDQVGDGWTLATWNPVAGHRMGERPAPDEPSPGQFGNTLYLIDPAGNRYAVTTIAPSGSGQMPRLVDWSGDGSRALFSTLDSVIVVDLHTGGQTSFPTHATARFSRPNGQALVLASGKRGERPDTLQRVDLDGNVQLTYPTDQLAGAGRFSGEYLESPDGTELVLGTFNPGNDEVPRADNSFVIMGNDGTVGRVLPAPMPQATCRATRWLTATDFVAACNAEKSAASQLWKVPLDGSAPTALTAVNSAKGEPGFEGDYGDTDAWQLPAGTFTQSLGACGVVFLSRLTADGHTERVKVPGAGNNINVVGATAGKLVLQSTAGCTPSQALMAYDPVANSTKVLLGPTVNGGRVIDSLTYGEGYRS